MSKIYIMGISGWIIPENEAQLLEATIALNVALETVDDFNYSSVSAFVKDYGGPSGAEGTRTLNAIVENFDYLGQEVPSEDQTDAMIVRIVYALDTTVDDVRVNAFVSQA